MSSAGGPFLHLHHNHALGAVLKLAVGAVCSGKASHHVLQELNLGKVNDGLGVDVRVHRTVHGGLGVVHDHVDIRGLSDTVWHEKVLD